MGFPPRVESLQHEELPRIDKYSMIDFTSNLSDTNRP